MQDNRTLIAGSVALAVAAGISWIATDTNSGQGANESSAHVSHQVADDRYPSQTATDWVTYSDHVISYTVLSEKALPMSEEEQLAGEGFTPRELTVRVNGIIWSKPGSSIKPPAIGSTMVRHAGGWTVHEGERTPWVDPDRPSLEPDHSYIEAVQWLTDGPDGTQLSPSWVGLGEGSKLPFDNSVIGKGENEGEIVSPTQFRAMEDEPGPATLEEQMAGKGASDLADALKAAEPAAPSP